MPAVFNHKTTAFKRLWPLFGLRQDEKIEVGAQAVKFFAARSARVRYSRISA